MSIYVNDEKIKTYLHDSIETIIDRIALKKESLPSYIHIFPSTELINKEYYKSTNVLDVLKNINLNDLVNQYKEILLQFPGLTAKDIGMLWIRLHGLPNETKLLKKISLVHFPGVLQMRENFKGYEELFKEKFEELKIKVKEHLRIGDMIKNIKKYSIDKFEITDIVIDLTIKLDNKETLIDIFDNINVSRILPFVILQIQDKRYYKIYNKVIPPFEWLEMTLNKESYIIIKLLKISLNKSVANLNNAYTTVYWNNENIISMDTELIQEITQNVLEQRFFSSIENLSYKISDRKQNAIKGNFNVQITNFNKFIFLDMVTNDLLISNILFLNEFGVKSASAKRRLYVYYYPQKIKNIDRALSLVITPDDKNLRVRISRSKSKDQIDQFLNIFSRILTRYQDEYDNLIGLYAKYIPIIKGIKPVSKAKIKITKNRLDPLYEFDSYLFRSPFYGRQCQKPKQPYVVPSDQVDAYIKKYGKDKIMEFPLTRDNGKMKGSSIYYACDPREPDEIEASKRTGKKLQSYPGVIPTEGMKPQKEPKKPRELEKYKQTLENLQKYREEIKYIPCCEVMPQLNKSYKKYTNFVLNEERIVQKKSSYIRLIADKPVPPDRDGVLPQNLKQLFFLGDSILTTIRRYGVVNSPNSFIHCMEKAFNPKYKSMSLDDREKYVKNIRKSLVSERPLPKGVDYNLGIVKQEMANYSIKDIKEYILDLDKYFDPSLFIRLLEYKYNCNIFLYVVDKNNQHGNVILPTHKNAYFMRDIDVNKQSVIIIKFTNLNILWPYQCEIIQDLRKKPTFVITDTDLIQKNIDVLYMSNNQYIVKDKKIFTFPPQEDSKWLRNAISQGIDGNGKVYMLNYTRSTSDPSGSSERTGPEGTSKRDKLFSLFVSPCAPLPIPIDDTIYKLDPIKYISKGNAHLAGIKLKIIGISPDGMGVYVHIKSFEESYIPLTKSISPEYKIIKSSIYIDDRYLNENSQLQIMQKNRKIAQYLKEYTLFVYSNNQGTPEGSGLGETPEGSGLSEGGINESNFTIDPNHHYDYKSLNRQLILDTPVMFKHSKLIVPSEEVRDKLIYYINVQKFNAPEALKDYKNRKLVEGHYEFISDFSQRSEQLIFIGIDDILYWLEHEISGTTENEVTNTLYLGKTAQ